MDNDIDIFSVDPQKGMEPDCWVILEMLDPDTDEIFHKVLAGWLGGYLDGDSWRMSSKIKEFDTETKEDYILAITKSGSEYLLHKKCEGLRMPIVGIYNRLMELFPHLVTVVNLGGEDGRLLRRGEDDEESA